VSLYRTIVVDPPWAFDRELPERKHFLYRADREGRGRNAKSNYATMPIEEIAAMSVNGWADEHAHLYLWTTNSFMDEAFDLVKAWGFKQKTILTWVKPRLGMGTYFRNNTEHVLFAVKGSLKTLRKDCRTAFYGEQGRHSEKPAAFYDLVETMSPGPYLDVFARKQRMVLQGPNAGELWATWGNECFIADGLPTMQHPDASGQEGPGLPV
jgi:N6-adenosine-specific RNA methylase IME4